MPPKLLALIIVTSVTCCGCASIDEMHGHAATPGGGAAPVRTAGAAYAPGVPELQRLFRYYRRVSTLSPKELDSEYQQASKAFAMKRSAENQWRMAMLLGIPGSAFYDSTRSSTLFKELTNEEFHQSAELNDAAYLMYSLLDAQSQLDKKLGAATDRLSEAQSANKKMQDQLDALKAIESTIYQRNKAEDTPKP